MHFKSKVRDDTMQNIKWPYRLFLTAKIQECGCEVSMLSLVIWKDGT